MDKIKQIEAFVNATEKGSLAKAALGQGVTPVMLGRRIDALERRLGIKLMHRTTRHLTLTERGTVFFDQCKKILDELDQAEKMIGEGLNKATGHHRLRSGCVRKKACSAACPGFSGCQSRCQDIIQPERSSRRPCP